MCFGFVDSFGRMDTIGMNSNKEVMDNSMYEGYETINQRVEFDVSEALSRSIRRASKENRLVQGLSEAVQLLDENPDEVMYCIVPSKSIDDITLQLHIKLLEAYCCENDIPLVKVDEMFASLKKDQEESEYSICSLVKYPGETDADDQDVINFFQNDSPYSYLSG